MNQGKRTMRYKSRNCPVCQKPCTIPEGTICSDCENEIEIMRSKAKAFDRIENGKENFGWRFASDLFSPQIYKDIEGLYSGFLVEKSLQELFEKAILSVAVITDHNKKYQDWYSVLCLDDGKKNIEEYNAALNKFIQFCYDTGVKDGKRLLIGLNSGEYSLEEFENSIIKRTH